MTLPEFLTEARYGEILLTGHRIGLYHVVSYYQEGETVDQLVCRYPTLPRELVEKVIAFYLENKPEVDAYVAREQAEIDRQRAAAPRRIDFEALRRRMEEMARSRDA
jgi:uncharacterized protein (DUF433 family)